MPIPLSHYWQQSPRDLIHLSHLEQLAWTLKDVSVLRRRRALNSLGVPSHLYKLRFPPDRGSSSRKFLKSILLSNQLYAADTESLNDPFDCSATYEVPDDGDALAVQFRNWFERAGASPQLSELFASSEAEAGPKIAEEVLRQGHSNLLRQLRVCALTAQCRDSVLWAHYGYEHRGLAIQFRPSLDPVAFQLSKIDYTDDYPVRRNYLTSSRGDLMTPLLRKAERWRYEDEWRIIQRGQSNCHIHFSPEALTAVIFGLRMSDEHKLYVTNLLQTRRKLHGVNTAIYQAEALTNSYGIRLRRYV